MGKKEVDYTSLTQSISKHVEVILDAWEDTHLQSHIRSLCKADPSLTAGILRGEGAFGDRIGNDLEPVNLYAKRSLSKDGEEKEANLCKAITAYFKTQSDKPAYPGETVYKAMKRTLQVVRHHIEQHPPEAQDMPAIQKALASIDTALEALHNDMLSLQRALPPEQQQKQL